MSQHYPTKDGTLIIPGGSTIKATNVSWDVERNQENEANLPFDIKALYIKIALYFKDQNTVLNKTVYFHINDNIVDTDDFNIRQIINNITTWCWHSNDPIHASDGEYTMGKIINTDDFHFIKDNIEFFYNFRWKSDSIEFEMRETPWDK